MLEKVVNYSSPSLDLQASSGVPQSIERFSIVFTANVRLKFPVYQKLVKFIWFQLIFCLLATSMEQVLKTEK